MPELKHATVRLLNWTVCTLFLACSMAELSPAQTASASANRRRAQLTQDSVTSNANDPNPSSLGAISAAVAAAVDRRLNADRQDELADPSLSPLRITAPNVNGEDEASTQSQPETPTPSNGGRINHNPGLIAIPLSTSIWHAASRNNGPDARPFADRSPVNLLRERRLSTRGSDSIRRTDNASSYPAPIFGAERPLRRNQVHISSPTGLSKARHQQETRLRDCSRLALGGLQCRAPRPASSASRHTLTQSYRKSLAAIF